MSSPASPRRSRGKLVSVGDRAPLSFFQPVRRLVATAVDARAFAPETGDHGALEKVYSRTVASGGHGANPHTVKAPIGQTVPASLDVTAGLIDLFDMVGDIADKAPEVTPAKHMQEKILSRITLLDTSGGISSWILGAGIKRYKAGQLRRFQRQGCRPDPLLVPAGPGRLHRQARRRRGPVQLPGRAAVLPRPHEPVRCRQQGTRHGPAMIILLQSFDGTKRSSSAWIAYPRISSHRG